MHFDVYYTCLVTNYIISNAFEYQSNTGYSSVIRAMYMWQLKHSAIDKHIRYFYFDVMVFIEML